MSVCSVRLSVCLSHSNIVSKWTVEHSYCLDFFTTEKPEPSSFFANIRLISKFERDHPERGRFIRLRWVRTGDFGDFLT